MSRKKTHEEYVAELAIKNPTVEVVEEYKGTGTKIMHHCLIHDVYWNIIPYSALQGYGCPQCHKERQSNSASLSHEQYIQKLSITNATVIPLEEYKGMKVPILHECLIHNIKWRAMPESILRGCGCTECKVEKIRNKLSKTHKQYVFELYKINPNIIPIEQYINASTPTMHRCLICGYEWKVVPDSLMRGYGCPQCAGNVKRTHDEYLEQLNLINPNIEPIEQYKNARTKILHQCKIDGYIWNVAPYLTLQGYGCPKCNESKGERAICIWLDKHNIDYIQQKTFDNCRDKQCLPFDFYLPDYNAIIEYQGKQHYESIDYFGGQENLEYTQRHDKIKSDYCKQNNIRLLCIRYDEDINDALTNFLFI